MVVVVVVVVVAGILVAKAGKGFVFNAKVFDVPLLKRGAFAMAQPLI